MASCADQNQARICVAGSLWGICDELVFANGLIVRTTLGAPSNSAFLVDGTGQCSDIVEFTVEEAVVDTDGCWRTCALVPNIGTVSGEFIEPGDTYYVIEVVNPLTNATLYTSPRFVIDADQIGTYPVDINGCVQLCVLSPPATATPTNPFCDAVQACETPWLGTSASPIFTVTPGDNPAGAPGNGHAPVFDINTTALCALVTATCETPWAGTGGPGIGITPGGVNGHAPTIDFEPSADADQALVFSPGDGLPYVRNSTLTLAGQTLTYTDNLGVAQAFDICAIIAGCSNLGNTSVVTRTIVAGLTSGPGNHNISHDDGTGLVVAWDVVGQQAGNQIAVGTGGNGGAYYALAGGVGTTVTAGAGAGEYVVTAPPSSVVPNLPAGIWTHNDNDPAGNNAVAIRSTSGDAVTGAGLVVGSDGGSFLDLVAGTNITITPGAPGVYTIAATPGGGGNTSVMTGNVVPGLVSGTGIHRMTHNDGTGVLTTWDVVSQEAGNMLAVRGAGVLGGSFMELLAGTGITITPGVGAGQYTIAANATVDCASVSAVFAANARVMTGADRVLVSDGAACERVQPTVRYHESLTYDEYCDTPACSPPIMVLRPGQLTAMGVAATTAPDANETWQVQINGVASAVAQALLSGNTSDFQTGLSLALSAGDVITLVPTGPTPTTPSTCGQITIEITEALA